MEMDMSTQAGMPTVWMLIFTLLLWLLFVAILLSNHRSSLNRWGFAAGIFFSLGVLKEYLYFGVAPRLLPDLPALSEELCTQIYSVLTALLYYLAMPSVLMLAFHFSEFPARRPRFFQAARFLVFLPSLLFAWAVPLTQTRYYQLYVPAYYLWAALYNCTYGVLVTILLLCTLHRSRLSYSYRQKSLIAVNVLLPMWYWLLSIFPVHVLGIRSLFKAWQGNILIIAFLVGYFIYHLFRDGIWGSHLTHETYDFESTPGRVRDNAAYVTHALKNELTKIEWAAASLLEDGASGQEQIGIVLNSVRHLRSFVDQTRLLSRDIQIQISQFPVLPVLEQCAASLRDPQVHIQICCAPDAVLSTDREHFTEMLQNLLNNARDAVAGRKDAAITLSYTISPAKRCAILAVSDNGCGIGRKDIRRIFQPYFTTKGASFEHLGLGLYYCCHVMERLGGGIRAKSLPARGSTFFLYFPYRKPHRTKTRKNGSFFAKHS